MIGYGAEDSHFVMELTYNYGISSYKQGNSFRGITIHSAGMEERARSRGYDVTNNDAACTVTSPGGYMFHLFH